MGVFGKLDLKKTNRNSQLKIWSVLLILTSLLLSILGVTNAWFTSGENRKIECIVNIGQINLNVYQVFSSGSEVLIKSNDENEESSTPSYVDLTNGTNDREIIPDQNYSLNLVLKNEDEGAQSLYVRYKIELYACNDNADIMLNPIITGYTTPTSTTNGFVYNQADGYYYYQNNNNENQTFESNSEATLIGGLTIPYSDFAYTGEYPTINGNNIRLVITIEGFDINPQA